MKWKEFEEVKCVKKKNHRFVSQKLKNQFDNLLLECYTTSSTQCASRCGYGGIGRRGSFRCCFPQKCRFESCYPHKKAFVKPICFTKAFFIYASSDENAILTQAFEERRDNLRNSQRVFLMVRETRFILVVLRVPE